MTQIPEGWKQRHALLLVTLAPILAVLVSVAFNAWYGVEYIQPLLTPLQNTHLQHSILIYNLIVFPPASALWAYAVFSLRPSLEATRRGASVAQKNLLRAQARAINLPWYFGALIAVANAVCIPVFLHAVRGGGEPVDGNFPLHLFIMVFIAAQITITVAFFIVELLVQSLVLPELFRDGLPAQTPGALTLSVSSRGLLMAVAAGIGPIAMLLLLGWADDELRGHINWFRNAVGALGVFFSLISVWLVGRLVAKPVKVLRLAAQSVAAGDLNTRIDLLAADEFGTLVDEFNRMVSELREKQRLRETFGLHVGEAAAEHILASNPGLGGQEREITILFCDIRGFTAYSAERPAAEVVHQLNGFLSLMVEIVERRHCGLINKYLGDGFMSLFGADGSDPQHARHAVEAAREMLVRVAPPFTIGIGIHTGPAIVGNIGSEHRLEYTAIGDTVNLASRVEGLSKVLGVPLVFTSGTRSALQENMPTKSLGEQAIRGQPRPIEVFTLSETDGTR